jgi:hypothetical protein
MEEMDGSRSLNPSEYYCAGQNAKPHNKNMKGYTIAHVERGNTLQSMCSSERNRIEQ